MDYFFKKQPADSTKDGGEMRSCMKDLVSHKLSQLEVKVGCIYAKALSFGRKRLATEPRNEPASGTEGIKEAQARSL